MKNAYGVILLLAIACGKPTSNTEQSESDTLISTSSSDTTTMTSSTDSLEPSKINDDANSLWESGDQQAEDPQNDALARYGGEYTLQSSSEAEEGSLILTYKGGNTYSIKITKMVADFCSGTIEGEFYVDEYNRGFFEFDGHPLEITLTLSGVEVKDPERQLGVDQCEYSGTYIVMGD